MKININSKPQQISGKAARTIRNQPGYRALKTMALIRTVKGGVRLYTEISGRYMDASLQEIPLSDLPGINI